MTGPSRLTLPRGLVRHIAERLILGIDAFGLVVLVDNGFVEHRQPVFEIVAQQRQAQQIFAWPRIVLAPRRRHRFGPLIQAIGAAPQPGQRHQPGALILAQAGDGGQQFLAHRIIGFVHQHIGLAVIGGIRAVIRIAIDFLHVIFPRLDDDEADRIERKPKLRRGFLRAAGFGRQ